MRVTRTNPQEYNDCSVLALASCLRITYSGAHNLLQKQGRMTGKGVDYLTWSQFLRDIGFTLVEDVINWRLEDVVKKYPKGRYIAYVTGHVFTIADGVVLDYNSKVDKRKVYRLYEWKRG